MQNINVCDAQRTPSLHQAVRCGTAPAVKKLFFYLGADVSVVKADKNLSKISKYPTQESSKIAVHAFITSILVCCNSLLYTVILGSYYNSKTGVNILGTG